MYELIRDSIVSLVHPAFAEAFPSVPIVFDNQPFDWNNPPHMFVEFEIRWYGANQINLSRNPRTRSSGCVYITAHTKAGAGARRNLEMLSWFKDSLGYAAINGVHLQAPQPVDDIPPAGWYTEGLKVGFYADD